MVISLCAVENGKRDKTSKIKLLDILLFGCIQTFQV